MTFLKSLSWVVSFPRTTYFNFSVLYLQIANRNTHGIRLSKKSTFLHSFTRDKRIHIKLCFRFSLIPLRWNLFLSSDNHCDRNCIWLNLSCVLKYPERIRMFLINFNLVKFLFEDFWVKRKLTRDVPVTWTTWNIFNIHKTLQ